MSVSIEQVQGDLDTKELILRSPVALVPWAEEKLHNFVSLSASVFIGKIDDKVACVWGFIQPSLLSQQAYMWLLTTKMVEEHPFIFIRRAQRHVQEMLKLYPLLVGECRVEDRAAQRWLKLLGARFGYTTEKTIPFSIEAK